MANFFVSVESFQQFIAKHGGTSSLSPEALSDLTDMLQPIAPQSLTAQQVGDRCRELIDEDMLDLPVPDESEAVQIGQEIIDWALTEDQGSDPTLDWSEVQGYLIDSLIASWIYGQ